MLRLNGSPFVDGRPFALWVNITHLVHELEFLAFGTIGQKANDGFRIVGNTEGLGGVDRIQVGVALEPAFYLGT